MTDAAPDHRGPRDAGSGIDGSPPGAKAVLADRISVAALLVVAGTHICTEFGAGPWTRLAAGMTLPVFFVLQWPSLAPIARGTVLAAALLLAYLWSSGAIGPETVDAAVSRAAFFTLFIIALDFLRDAATTSPLVLRSGEMIVNQPPGRRYLMLALGGHLFGVLLNLGAVHVLGSMARRAIEDGRANGDARLREIRLRRMTTALLRGFAATTLWAPTSITVAVVLATMPEFTWPRFLPGALATAVGVLSFGWILDRLTYRRPAQGASQPMAAVLVRLLPLASLNALLISCTLVISWLLSIQLILSLILCVPVFAACWLIVQHSQAGQRGSLIAARRRVGRHTVPGLVGLRSEIGIMAGSGLLSVLLVSQKDPAVFAAAFVWLGLADGAILAFTAVAIFVIALIGINPIISVTVALEMLRALPGLEVSPYRMALLGSMVWALSNGFSPFSATVRLTARNVDRPATVVGFVWNGAFTVALLAVLCLVLLLPV